MTCNTFMLLRVQCAFDTRTWSLKCNNWLCRCLQEGTRIKGTLHVRFVFRAYPALLDRLHSRRWLFDIYFNPQKGSSIRWLCLRAGSCTVSRAYYSS